MPESFEDQAALVFANLKAILEAAGMGMTHIVKASVFLKDMDDFSRLNDIYSASSALPFQPGKRFRWPGCPKTA
jgi:2-iminobutanoate/2-iminopropanoate deaminase